MFSIIDYKCPVKPKKLPKALANYGPSTLHQNAQLKKISLDKFVGPRFRSTSGCVECRKRHKKCDEKRPSCQACNKRNTPCVYRTAKSGNKTTASVNVDCELDLELSRACATADDNDVSILPMDQEDLPAAQVISQEDIASLNQEFVEDIIELPATSHTHLELSPLSQLATTVPLSLGVEPISSFLDARGVSYLQYFKEQVSNRIALSPESSNYFCITFLRLAQQDERIANILASWGAYFVHKSRHEDVTTHYEKALTLRESHLLGSDAQLLVQLCFYLSLVGFFVCQGDTSLWWDNFCKCHELIKEQGVDLRDLLKRFNCSNDAKFLLSNFFYHDIMSSNAFSHGPKVTIKEYQTLFAEGFFDSSYGMDPLQGCMNSVYMLLAEELEVREAMRVRRNRLDDILNNDIRLEDDPIVQKEFEAMRTAYLEHCEEMLEYFRVKIIECEISEDSLQGTPQEDQVLLRNVFELFRTTCKVYWSVYLKRCPPNSFEPQLALLRMLNKMEQLVDSRMVVVLCLPLIIAGVTSYTVHDRSRVSRLFKLAQEKCPVQNLKKAWFLIEETWKRNAVGSLSKDWTNICEEMNWQLCVC